MPNEITVQPVSGVRANGDSTIEVKSLPGEPSPLPVSTAAPTPLPNPNLRLDPALGLVVIEFRNETSDALTTSIPSQRQLEAYQRWDVTHFGPTPLGLHTSDEPSASEPKAEPHVRSPPEKVHKSHG